MKKINRFELWIANLDPRFGTEPGKIRPVLIVQSNLLNKIHPSTLVCPITTKVELKSNILRVHLPKGTANVEQDCDIMIDQVRAIDNKRLIRKIGILPDKQSLQVMTNLSIVLDLSNP